MKPMTLRSLLLGALLTLSTLPALAQKTPTAEDAKTRLAKAEALFHERCKKAGEFIHRTAENVDGILLMKIRPNEINRGDQYKMDDPYGHDSGGETYIKVFFSGFYRTPSDPPLGWAPRLGYSYVDALDPKDGQRYRYTGAIKAVGKQDPTASNLKLAMSKDPNYDLKIYSFVLDKIVAPDPAPPPRCHLRRHFHP